MRTLITLDKDNIPELVGINGNGSLFMYAIKNGRSYRISTEEGNTYLVETYDHFDKNIYYVPKKTIFFWGE